MADSATELQAAVVAALQADGDLTALLGGAKVFDHVPDGTALPFVALGRSAVADWSTGTERGERHALAVHVWSLGSSRGEAFAILHRAERVLEALGETLGANRLVNIRIESRETRREPGETAFRGVLRLRAVTERAD